MNDIESQTDLKESEKVEFLGPKWLLLHSHQQLEEGMGRRSKFWMTTYCAMVDTGVSLDHVL